MTKNLTLHTGTIIRREKQVNKFTMTQVLVVLAFIVDIFTIACSFLSCSIKELLEPRRHIYFNSHQQIQKYFLDTCYYVFIQKQYFRVLTCSVSEAFGLSSVVPGCVQYRWQPCDRHLVISIFIQMYIEYWTNHKRKDV